MDAPADHENIPNSRDHVRVFPTSDPGGTRIRVFRGQVLKPKTFRRYIYGIRRPQRGRMARCVGLLDLPLAVAFGISQRAAREYQKKSGSR